jgi:hypothetical protein
VPDATALSASPTIVIRPWADPVVDEDGHDPRSRYVELFWLGVLGPTATWLIRRLAAGLDREPEGYELDLGATAREMGLGFTVGRASPFTKALQRCVMFGMAHPMPTGLAVRRRIPTVAHRHLKRMPETVRVAHEEWQRTTISVDELSRAHRLGLALAEAGDEPALVEHQLVALGVRDATAAEVADNLSRLRPAS